MKVLLLFMALMTAAPIAAATVQTANGDWSQLPPLTQMSVDHLDSGVILGIQSVAVKEKCKLPGLAGRNLDSRLSFAAQFDPDGSLNRVVLPRLNCPKVEGALGGLLIEMINAGDYRHNGQNSTGWYRGELIFSYQS